MIERIEQVDKEYDGFVFRAVTNTLNPGSPLLINVDQNKNVAVVNSLEVCDSILESAPIYYGPADTANEANEIALNFNNHWN